jgi:hypothetical protein
MRQKGVRGDKAWSYGPLSDGEWQTQGSGEMSRFMVRCYSAGKWDRLEPRELEAENELQAAQQACGVELADAGKPGQLRAQVWPSGSPGKKSMFYDRSDRDAH